MKRIAVRTYHQQLETADRQDWLRGQKPADLGEGFEEEGQIQMRPHPEVDWSRVFVRRIEISETNLR